MNQEGLKEKLFKAVPDTVDFGDILYKPDLKDLPRRITLDDYRTKAPDILDQHKEDGLGKCIGFALATVCNYLLKRSQKKDDKVSPHMLYHMSKRYSESKTAPSNGASARSAIKGWHKHGVCSEDVWEKLVDMEKTNEFTAAITYLSDETNHMKQISNNAASRPLGRYFRVNHKDLNAMQTAIAEANVLFATAIGHSGWDVERNGNLGRNGEIKFVNEETNSGHAFVIVGYDEHGFWIQNSWGTTWGLDGYGHLSYTDWLKNGLDVWVARLGVPIAEVVDSERTNVTFPFEPINLQPKYDDLRAHIIDISNNITETNAKKFSVTKSDIDSILDEFIGIAGGNNWKEKKWEKKRLLLYAPNFFEDESSVSNQMNAIKDILKFDAEVYPLAIIWRDEYWTTLYNLLSRAKLSTHPGVNNNADELFGLDDNFLVDRYEYTADIFTTNLRGNKEWQDMKKDTFRLKKMHLLADSLASRIKDGKIDEIHVVAHGAGAVFMAAFVQLLALRGKINEIPEELRLIDYSAKKEFQGKGCLIESCTLWAPACTVSLFKNTFLQAINQAKAPSPSNGIKKFNLFTLSDEAEQDDSFFQGYGKSFLYYISNSLESDGGVSYNQEGEPILGMKKFVDDFVNDKDPYLPNLFSHNGCSGKLLENGNNHITTPHFPIDKLQSLRTYRHDDFSNDMSILNTTLDCIVGKDESIDQKENFNWRTSSERIIRRILNKQISFPRHTGRSIRIGNPGSGGD